MPDVLLPSDGRDKQHQNGGSSSNTVSVERSFVPSSPLLNLTLETLQSKGTISSTDIVILYLESLVT